MVTNKKQSEETFGRCVNCGRIQYIGLIWKFVVCDNCKKLIYREDIK
jgi:hypothetical protein